MVSVVELHHDCHPDAVNAAELWQTIYEAATDGTDQFRYLVGDDAKAWAAMLAGMDGEQYFANMSTVFGL